jgi:hypothetical protein
MCSLLLVQKNSLSLVCDCYSKNKIFIPIKHGNNQVTQYYEIYDTGIIPFGYSTTKF